MTLITASLFFAFSTLGLGMLYLSQIYLKLGAYKKNSIVLEYASENGIKQGFDQLAQTVMHASSPIILSPEKMEELKVNAEGNGTKTVEELLGETIPLLCDNEWENLKWSAKTDFFINRIEESDDYIREFFDVLIQSEGFLLNFNQKRTSSLEAVLEIWAGYVPLPTIPFHIDKKLNQEQKEQFIQENEIEIIDSETAMPASSISSSPEELIPADATQLISKALKINIFHPQDLSSSLLREALGLDPTIEPVPAGVYLIQDDLGLGGIFVEGNLDELVLAIDHGFQVISFRLEDRHWLLMFNPTTSETIFSTPEDTQIFNLIPRGIIIVNGAIHSLGGGIVEQPGTITMIKDEEIPCILSGVDLTIISSEKITLSSHLIHQGMKWEDGIPYVEDSDSQLHIFASGQDILGDRNGEGEIVIALDSPDDIKIQASLTASGKGISAGGENKTVNLVGSIQTSDYNSSGAKLKITFDDRFMSDDTFLENTPKSAKPILRVATFGASEWREF